jgi:chromosome segregation ATPase
MATDKTLNPPIQPENSATNPPELMRIINGAYNAGRAEDYQNRLQKNGVPTTSVDIASLKRSRERKSQISQDQFQKYKAPLQQYLSTGKVTSDAAGADENGSSIPGNSHFASMDEKLTIMELEIENLKKKNEILAEQLKGATTAPKLGEPQICALVQEQVRSASQQNFTSLISDKLPEIIQEAQKAAAAMVEQSVQTIVKAQIGEGMKDITKIKEDLQRLDAFKERVEDANLPHLNDRLSKLETLEKRLAKVEGAEASVHDIAQDIKDELKSVKNDRLSKLETLEKRLTKVEGTEASVHDITQDIKDELKSVKNDQHALESSYKDSMHKLESSVESTSKTASLLDDKFTAVFKSASQVVEAQQVATEAQQAAAEAQTTVTQLEAKMKEMEQSVSMKHEVARTTTKLEARIKALEQSTLNLDQPRNTQYEIAQTTQKFERGLNEVQTNLSKTNEDLNLLNNALAQAEDGLLNAKIDIETLKEQAPRLVDDYLSKTGARSEGYENRLRDLAHQFVDLSGKVEILEQRPVEAQLTLSHPVATTLLKKIEETAQSLHQLHGSRLDNMSSELQKLQGAITDTLNQNALAIRDLEHRYQQISTDQLYHNIMHWVTENYADVPGLAAQLGSVQTSIKDIRTRVSTVESWSEVVERVGTNWQSITESIRSIMQIESRLLENQNGIVKVEATLTDLSKNLIHRAELKAICEAIQQHINHERSESVARDEALGMRIDPLARNVQKVESAIGQVNDVLGFKEDIVKACGRFPFQEARLGNIESMIRDLNANSDNPLRGMNFDVQPHT